MHPGASRRARGQGGQVMQDPESRAGTGCTGSGIQGRDRSDRIQDPIQEHAIYDPGSMMGQIMQDPESMIWHTMQDPGSSAGIGHAGSRIRGKGYSCTQAWIEGDHHGP